MTYNAADGGEAEQHRIREYDSKRLIPAQMQGTAGMLILQMRRRLLMEKEKGSIGMLQRYFKIGFNRAARIMDQLEEAGIVRS